MCRGGLVAVISLKKKKDKDLSKEHTHHAS